MTTFFSTDIDDRGAEQFQVIAADPPWQEPGGCDRGADDHYETLDREDILATMVKSPLWMPAKNSHLYLWSTMTSLPDGLWLMGALGFTYKTHVPWVKSDGQLDLAGQLKLTIGLGQYFRGAHELVLLGTRGKGFAVRTDAKNIPSVIIAPVPRENGKRVHSAKPDKFYELVEARSAGRKLEMFSRRTRPGWVAWGDQVGSLDQEQKQV